MHVIRSKPMAWALAALIAAAGAASAADGWVAVLDVEEALEAYTVRIVATSEEDCLAQASTYRDAVVIEPCHRAEPSAITDPNDANRTSKTPRPKKMADGGGGGGW